MATKPGVTRRTEKAAESRKQDKTATTRVRLIEIPIGQPLGRAGGGGGIDLGGESPALETGTFHVSKAAKAKQDQAPGFRGMPNDTALSRMELNGQVIAPVLPLRDLAELPDQSSVLRQCIEAMSTNIDGFGYDFVYDGPDGKDESKEAQAELARLKSIFLTINSDVSFTTLRKRFRTDRETVGFGCLEVLRLGEDDEVGGFMLEHLPAMTMRMTRVDKEPVEVDIVQRGYEGEIIERTIRKRFRRFVQVLDNGQKVYFKQFGDPREIFAKNGRAVPDPLPEGATVEPDDLATEVLCSAQYSVQTPYGLPRHTGNMPSIRGLRAADQVNETFFQKNAIPAMVVMVSGGHLTEDSFTDIAKYFRDDVGSGSRFHRILVIEATPHERSMEDKGTASVSLKPLQNERMTDAQFLKYEDSGLRKIRSSYRLPGLYVGLGDDSNYAIANASRQTVEEQVFQPERAEFDDMINLQLLSGLEEPPQYWRFSTKGPEIADLATYVAAITAFAACGALTINAAIKLQNELLGTSLKLRTEAWADYPWALVQALVAKGQLKDLDAIMVEQPDLATLLKGMPGGRPGAPGAVAQPPAKNKGTQPSEAGDRAEGKPPVPQEGDQRPEPAKKGGPVAAIGWRDDRFDELLRAVAALALKIDGITILPSAAPLPLAQPELLKLASGMTVRRGGRGLR